MPDRQNQILLEFYILQLSLFCVPKLLFDTRPKKCYNIFCTFMLNELESIYEKESKDDRCSEIIHPMAAFLYSIIGLYEYQHSAGE